MGNCTSARSASRADTPTADPSAAPAVHVYGATWCEWSRKQERALRAHGVPFEMTWCDRCDPAACRGCADAKAFPLLVFPDGTRRLGFHGAALVQSELAKF